MRTRSEGGSNQTYAVSGSGLLDRRLAVLLGVLLRHEAAGCGIAVAPGRLRRLPMLRLRAALALLGHVVVGPSRRRPRMEQTRVIGATDARLDGRVNGDATAYDRARVARSLHPLRHYSGAETARGSTTRSRRRRGGQRPARRRPPTEHRPGARSPLTCPSIDPIVSTTEPPPASSVATRVRCGAPQRCTATRSATTVVGRDPARTRFRMRLSGGQASVHPRYGISPPTQSDRVGSRDGA